MQRIDYWVGVPLCAVCSVLQSIISLIMPRFKRVGSPKKILYIELSEMGSAILAYPTLRHTGELFPGVEIHFLIFRTSVESIELLGLLPHRQVHVIEDANIWSFARSALGVLLKLRFLGFDVVIDMELFSRCTALMSFFIGAPAKVGFHKYTEEGLYRGNFLTHRVLYNPHFHISQNFAALLEAVNESAAEEPLVKKAIPRAGMALPLVPVLAETELAVKHFRGLWHEYSSETPIVLLNPDPGVLSLRGWSIDSYRLLTERLLDLNPLLRIGVIGLKRSFHFYEAIVRGLSDRSRVFNLCGTTRSMRELLGFFSISSVLVTNDCGPAHFAPLVRLPTVVLFGPESPRRYAPLGQLNTSLYAQLACSPCFSAQNHRRSVCTNNRCLQAISVDEVFRATVLALSQGAVAEES